jgi:PAS domain S-box-containing protein
VRLQAKIFAFFLPLALAAAALGAYAARRETERLMVRELGRRLRPQAEALAAGLARDLEARREGPLLARLQAAQAATGAAYAEALAADGVVAAHTNVLETGRTPSGPGVRAALAAAETTYAREDGPRGALLALSSPVWRPDDEFLLSGGPRRRLGTLRLGLPLAATLESARDVGAWVAALAAVFSALGLLLSLAMTRYVLGSVRAISAATARVAAGDYGAHVPVGSRDELGELAVSFNRMGAALSRTVVSRDRLEEALAIARATLEASADGILVVDRGLRAILYNPRFVEMWGLTEEIARGGDIRRMAELVADQTEDPEYFMSLATRAPDADDEAERRDSIRLKDGRVFDRISRPYRIGGKVVGRTITTRDLTLHLEGMKALSRARDEALEAARAKARFIANVSHELRTPLNAVVGAAELLALAELAPKEREHVEMLERGARALLELIDGVLDFSKIEAVRMTIERAPLTPGGVLADAVALVAPRAAEKRLSLRVDPGEAAGLALLGDPARLRQVLLNLLSNAVKFTDRGEIAAVIRILSRSDAAVELEFSVSDTGIGITDEQAKRLFSPFSQGDSSTTRLYGGTGLGLAISKSLAELMGGELGFESEPGRGARFFLRLKLDRVQLGAPPAAARVSAPVAPGPRDRLRALVVDDNDINRLLLARQLERLGCAAVCVADGRAALERLRADDFGLVLLDCQMPGLDGDQTAVEIRRLEAGRRRVPIVAISANASEVDRRRSLEAGMDDFVSKPASLGDLAAVVERWDRPFDETALAGFAGLAADAPGGLARLLEQFLADARARLGAAREGLSRGDRRACEREPHALRGAAASVGARGLRELCRRLEAGARAGEDAAALSSLLDQADAEVVRLTADASRRTSA